MTKKLVFAPRQKKMLQTIGGDCQTAVGGLAEINNKFKFKAQLFSDKGDDNFNFELLGKDTDALNIGKNSRSKIIKPSR